MRLYVLAAATAVVVANGYYIQPIITRVAADFGITTSMSGIVPAVNQMALAAGILLLLPLGDKIGNRRLTLIFVAPQLVALVGMAFAKNFAVFALSSTLLGFFNVTPYLIPAYVSKRVQAARLGYATAVLATGVTAGILFARIGGGLIGEYFGWRAAYLAAAGLMLCVCFGLPLIIEKEPAAPRDASAPTYWGLLRSLPAIMRAHPDVVHSGVIQALNFGTFLAVWLGLSLHLTSPQMGYGVDVVGYLSAISLANLMITPRLGALADRSGPRRARLVAASVQLACLVLLWLAGGSIWLMVAPILALGVAGNLIDVTGRMTFLDRSAEIRTRLMTVYITLTFLGGGLASWAGTAAYGWAGWKGTGMLTLAISAVTLAMSLSSYRSSRR